MKYRGAAFATIITTAFAMLTGGSVSSSGRWRRADSSKNTVIVYTADHGERAGAHGMRQKGGTIYREETNVPMIIVHPDVRGWTPFAPSDECGRYRADPAWAWRQGCQLADRALSGPAGRRHHAAAARIPMHGPNAISGDICSTMRSPMAGRQKLASLPTPPLPNALTCRAVAFTAASTTADGNSRAISRLPIISNHKTGPGFPRTMILNSMTRTRIPTRSSTWRRGRSSGGIRCGSMPW